MINLNTNIAKQRALFYINQQMQVIENSFALEIRRVLNKQYSLSADFVELGSTDFDHVMGVTYKMFSEVMNKYYKRIYNLFGNIIIDAVEQEKSFNRYERKGIIKDTFLKSIIEWVRRHFSKQIIIIDKVTTDKIKKIVADGVTKGLSNKDIAASIRKLSTEINAKRAMKIARTETHTVCQKSMQTAMDATELNYEHEWMSASDKRTRKQHVKANGERVPKGKPFTRTGESLMYPGDPAGSGWNIIHCRCIELFHTV